MSQGESRLRRLGAAHVGASRQPQDHAYVAVTRHATPPCSMGQAHVQPPGPHATARATRTSPSTTARPRTAFAADSGSPWRSSHSHDDKHLSARRDADFVPGRFATCPQARYAHRRYDPGCGSSCGPHDIGGRGTTFAASPHFAGATMSWWGGMGCGRSRTMTTMNPITDDG